MASNRRLLIIFLNLVILGTSLDASEKITFHSQAKQDEFVCTILYNLLGKQDSGYYLEIGAGEPIDMNNTYALEKDCGWQGLSIDISDHLMPRWHAERSNPFLLKDATQLDYCSVLEGFPQVIDYLSLDIDGDYDTVLRKVMQSNHIFKVITIEHDAYRYGDSYRNKERKILAALGYYLLCADVSHNGYPFEDWWIHPDFFSSFLFQQLLSLNLQGKDCMEVMQSIKTLISLPSES
jgi:hypothetical protein